MLKCPAIVTYEIDGYCQLADFVRVLRAKNEEAVVLCKKYGISPQNIRVAVFPLEGASTAVIEFAVPGPVYDKLWGASRGTHDTPEHKKDPEFKMWEK